MSIASHPDWDLSERGKKDAERHRKKIDDAIRKNVKDVISEESIITKKRGKKVRIPVKGLKDYRFIYNHRKRIEGEDEGAGIGHGQGKPGDVVGKRLKQADGDGPGGKKPGDQPGEDYIETEVDIDYLIEIMFQDLGLPWIEEKTKAHQLVPKGWKFDTISKKGIIPRLHKKRTMKEAIKRSALFLKEIMEETKCSEEDADIALTQAKNDINEAIELIKNNKLDRNIEPYIHIEDEDLRYKQIEEDVELHSNAVVIAMMDTSGSMTTDKKYLCRSLLFWLVEFLKKMYDHVQIKFITHTTDAKVVDEETFFHKGESGGTYCWSAIEKATYLIETEYPTENWNVYCVYVSDGEDWDPDKTIRYIKELLKKDINMLSYNEIDTSQRPDSIQMAFGSTWGNSNTLMKAIKNEWKFKSSTEAGAELYRNDKEHFLLSVIKNKDHVYPVLKYILFKERGNG